MKGNNGMTQKLHATSFLYFLFVFCFFVFLMVICGDRAVMDGRWMVGGGDDGDAAFYR